MKKVLGLALSLVVIIGLSACGGGSTATKGQSSGAASAVTPMLAKSVSTGGNIVSMANINEAVNVSGSIPETPFACPTSGTVTVSGTYSVSGDTTNLAGFSIIVDTTAAFNSCDGTDTRCNLAYLLTGSIAGHISTTVDANGTDYTFISTEKGTVNVALTGFSTFDCPVDLTLTITSADIVGFDNETVDDVLSKMTGTICGQTVAEIKTLIDSSDAVYCAGVKEIASGSTAS
ncbi:MAG: hypothetical protein NTY22_02845 [Proteobacteria bacterium]|nr:hypothetical protein [Pseudomonadota bacterium]